MLRGSRTGSRRMSQLAPMVAIATLVGGFFAMSGVSSAVTTVKGSAFGVSAPNITIFGGVQTPYGPKPTVTLPAGGSTTTITATDPSENVTYGPATFFDSGAVTVTTKGTPAGGVVTSTASISSVTQPAGSCPGTETSCIYNGPFTADSLSSSCIARSTGKTITPTITNGQLVTAQNTDGTTKTMVTIPTHPAANYTVNGYLYAGPTDKETFTYVFNEQTVNGDGSTTDNIGHEIMHGPTAVGDVIFGQTKCGVS